MVVNDSPTDVLLVGTTGLAAAMAGMLRGPWPASPLVLLCRSRRRQGAAAQGCLANARDRDRRDPDRQRGRRGRRRGRPGRGQGGLCLHRVRSCHALSDAGATGTVGPNLDESSVDFAAAQQTQITNSGGGMQAYSGTLSEEIANVAAYVVSPATDPRRIPPRSTSSPATSTGR